MRGDARFTSSTSTTLAKIGTGAELPLAGAGSVHRRAGDVGRQQVGGALHPPEAAADRGRQRLGEQRLAGARHTLDQEVPAGEQGDEARAARCRRTAHRTLDGVGERTGDFAGIAGVAR